MASVTFTGDWAKATKIALTMRAKFLAGLERAVLKEANLLRGWMINGIAAQAPGGAAFAALSPVTLALRKAQGFGGTKALIRTGALRGSISVLKLPGGAPKVFVGVLRKSRAKDGKSLANVAEIHEFGATIKKTRKMLRYLFAMIGKAGGTGPVGRDAKGRFTRGKYTGASSGPTIRIPPRPFVQPTFDAHAKPEAVKKRFYAAIAKAMDGDWGTFAGNVAGG